MKFSIVFVLVVLQIILQCSNTASGFEFTLLQMLNTNNFLVCVFASNLFSNTSEVISSLNNLLHRALVKCFLLFVKCFLLFRLG